MLQFERFVGILLQKFFHVLRPLISEHIVPVSQTQKFEDFQEMPKDRRIS